MQTPTDPGRGTWSAEAYARSFALLCAGAVEPLLAAGGVATPGVRVLDVGTGTGSLATAALQRGADVTAVEPDPAMLAHAPGGPRYVAGGLPDLPFDDDAFDAVLANFVINHVADPRAGVRDMARTVVPGGRVAVTIWPTTRSALNDLWTRVIESSGAVPPTSHRLPPEVDFPRSRKGLRELLEGAGLIDVRVTETSWQHRADPEAFWLGAAAGNGGIGQVIGSQPAQIQERMKAAYDASVLPLLDGQDLVLPCRALLASGVRKGSVA